MERFQVSREREKERGEESQRDVNNRSDRGKRKWNESGGENTETLKVGKSERWKREGDTDIKAGIKTDKKSDRAEAKVICMIEKDEGMIANLFEGQSGHKDAASVHASNLPSVYPSSHPTIHLFIQLVIHLFLHLLKSPSCPQRGQESLHKTVIHFLLRWKASKYTSTFFL